MSLDIALKKTVVEYKQVYDGNITHNLNEMAKQAGLYGVLWRPEGLGFTKASQLIPLIEAGLTKLEADPAFFKQFDSPNGWGTYDDFVPFVRDYLGACKEHPDADVEVSR